MLIDHARHRGQDRLGPTPDKLLGIRVNQGCQSCGELELACKIIVYHFHTGPDRGLVVPKLRGFRIGDNNNSGGSGYIPALEYGPQPYTLLHP